MISWAFFFFIDLLRVGNNDLIYFHFMKLGQMERFEFLMIIFHPTIIHLFLLASVLEEDWATHRSHDYYKLSEGRAQKYTFSRSNQTCYTAAQLVSVQILCRSDCSEAVLSSQHQ